MNECVMKKGGDHFLTGLVFGFDVGTGFKSAHPLRLDRGEERGEVSNFINQLSTKL